MPVRIRFTGAATLDSTITIQWTGGYPPSTPTTAVETIKPIRSAAGHTTRGGNALEQAINYYNALVLDFSANFTITRIGNDVIVNALNGSSDITATTTSANVVINPSVSQVAFLSRPQQLTPVYNPVTFSFFSANYSQPGHRYVINLYEINSDSSLNLLSKFKVTPDIDGSGYIDVSKPLSNLTTVDFNPDTTTQSDLPNSYVNYRLGIGEEFQVNWVFSQAVQISSGTYLGKTKLVQSPNITPHTYLVGDQIIVQTDITGTGTVINGLHTVVNVPNAYEVILDVNNPIAGTTTVAGISSYADGRKTLYSNVQTADGMAINGAVAWASFLDWSSAEYYHEAAGGNADCKLLTTLKTKDEIGTNPDNRYYVTNDQAMWMNFAVDTPDYEYAVYWEWLNSAGGVIDSSEFLVDNGAPYGNMRQFLIGFDMLGITPEAGQSLQFRLWDPNLKEFMSKYYILYADTRCRLEDIEIAYMDRLGSIQSQVFPLRSVEKGTISRESAKKGIKYNETFNSYDSAYAVWDRGTEITSVNLNREWELSTNWLSDGDSRRFEELLTSPYTWIKLGKDYLACTVNDAGFTVEKQKNRRLIRKQVTVKLANENIINI